jgi:hypothetical protein
MASGAEGSMNDPGEQRDFVIRLRPLNGDGPAVVRLRRALKCLLRSFRLKAVEVVEVPARRPADGEATERRTR